MKIILGSKSQWRKLVLERAGYQFEVLTAEIDEKAVRSDDYKELPLLLARAKAKAILPQVHEPALLITSDQVVVCNGELREKPENETQAREFLKSYAHYPAQTNTAVVVINTQTSKSAEGLDIATIFFKPIPENVIDELIIDGKIMTGAGGYIIEHPLLEPFIDHVDGEVDSVMGMPVKLMAKLMNEVK